MTLPVFFPPSEYASVLPRGQRMTLRDLCARAGVRCRVTGPPAQRPLRLARSGHLRALCTPGPLSEVWLAVPAGNARSRALLALGLLAYGVFDYGARESLRGLDVSRPSPGPGRPSTGTALSSTERQRRYRQRRNAQTGIRK